jgi:TetR/AcrR family transcriptional regulator, transcriptional repressor for nem operon
MRNEIKSLATRLFTLVGYRGVSFADLTEELGTTRANVHYHFGSKAGLAEEVLKSAAEEVLRTYRGIWANPQTTLREKFDRSYAFNLKRYQLYNGEDEGRIWSLITRFRMDMDVITPTMVATLRDVTTGNEEWIERGVQIAVDSGELEADAPVAAIAALIAGVVHFASLISQAPHDIHRLQQTYQALCDLIYRAHASPSAQRN